MGGLISMASKYYYNKRNFKLILGDSLEELKKIKKNSVDMIFADPPYFLSGDGISCSGGKMVSVNKGAWDKKIGIEEKHQFNREWIRLCYNVLKDEGTIWISGTLHNIYSIGMALEQEGFKIINNITWKKLINGTEIILLQSNRMSMYMNLVKGSMQIPRKFLKRYLQK